MAFVSCVLCGKQAAPGCKNAGGVLCRNHQCKCGNHRDRASGSMRGRSSEDSRQVGYHSALPCRVLRALRKWCRRQAAQGKITVAWDQHFETRVDWLARLPNVDCACGDPALETGPLQGLPRVVFQDYFLRFRVQRFRFARIRWQQWSRGMWERWVKVRRPGKK